MARLLTYPEIILSINGRLVDGSLLCYQTGSTSPKDAEDKDGNIYSDPSNIPIESGKCDLWLNQDFSYTLVFKDSDGKILSTFNNIAGIPNPNEAAINLNAGITLEADLNMTGNSLITNSSKVMLITPNGTGNTNITNLINTGDLYTNTHFLILDDTKKFIDSSGLDLLTFSKTAAAVNYITITNSNSSGMPTISSGGQDDSVHLKLAPKGTGQYYIGNFGYPTSLPTIVSAMQTDGNKAISFSRKVVLPLGFIDGLILSNNAGDANNDIDISVGDCDPADHTYAITLATSITKQIDAGWAEGTAAGGRASGVSLSTNTWYHVFVLSKNDGTTSTDAGFDTSTSATNLLATAAVVSAGYTKYRRIGSVRTDGSSHIRGFVQYHDKFLFKSGILDFNSSLSSGTTTVTLTVPSTAIRATINILSSDLDSLGGHALISTPFVETLLTASINGVGNALPLAVMAFVILSPSGGVTYTQSQTVTTPVNNSQIRLTNGAKDINGTSNQLSGGPRKIATLGWVDNRGDY
jgi:hypothetical protein